MRIFGSLWGDSVETRESSDLAFKGRVMVRWGIPGLGVLCQTYDLLDPVDRETWNKNDNLGYLVLEIVKIWE